MIPVPLPPPYGGVNEMVPIIAVSSPDCQNLFNFNVTQNGIELRKGDSIFRSFNLTNIDSTPLAFFVYDESVVLMAVADRHVNNMEIWKITTSAATVGLTVAGTVGTDTAFASILFNKYLFLFNNAFFAPGFSFDGTSFHNPLGYTGDGVNTFTPFGGNNFNNRTYMIQLNDPGYWYSAVNAISGACVKVSLASIISENANLSTIASITLSDNITTVTYQAFVFSGGEVLFYQGDYPAAPNWALVGRAKVGQPLNYNSVTSYQGDSLLFCDTGVISLRDLFLKGSENASSLTVNTRIQKTWQNMVQTARTTYGIPNGPITNVSAGAAQGNIRGVWDPTTNRIIISFPWYLDSSGTFTQGSFFFVFNTILQSWFFHRSYGVANYMIDMCRFNNKILMLAHSTSTSPFKAMVYTKEGATSYTDKDSDGVSNIPYSYEVKSAPISGTGTEAQGQLSRERAFFSKNPAGTSYVKKIEGLDVILESDLYAQTSYTLIKDFGVQTSAGQKTSSGSGLQKVRVDVGIEGTYIQYKISGATVVSKTVGLNIYGINVLMSEGGATV